LATEKSTRSLIPHPIRLLVISTVMPSWTRLIVINEPGTHFSWGESTDLAAVVGHVFPPESVS
jgi:hypothetical protein